MAAAAAAAAMEKKKKAPLGSSEASFAYCPSRSLYLSAFAYCSAPGSMALVSMRTPKGRSRGHNVKIATERANEVVMRRVIK